MKIRKMYQKGLINRNIWMIFKLDCISWQCKQWDISRKRNTIKWDNKKVYSYWTCRNVYQSIRINHFSISRRLNSKIMSCNLFIRKSNSWKTNRKYLVILIRCTRDRFNRMKILFRNSLMISISLLLKTNRKLLKIRNSLIALNSWIDKSSNWKIRMPVLRKTTKKN